MASLGVDLDQFEKKIQTQDIRAHYDSNPGKKMFPGSLSLTLCFHSGTSGYHQLCMNTISSSPLGEHVPYIPHSKPYKWKKLVKNG